MANPKANTTARSSTATKAVTVQPPVTTAKTQAAPVNGNGNGKDKFFNELRLTVHIAGTPQMKYAESGNAWTKARAFVSMGKNASGGYKPSLFVTLKAFGDVAEWLNGFEKKALVTVVGRLAYEEWKGKDGTMRSDVQIICDEVIDANPDAHEVPPEPEL